MSKRGIFDTKDMETTPFTIASSIVITTLLLLAAMFESAFLFRVGIIGLLIIPILNVYCGQKINAWFDKYNKHTYTSTSEEDDESEHVSRILED